MYIEQLYTNCLAEAAYYVESEGEAVIIDPIRETEQYVRKAAERGAKITYVLETHFHADFISGHLDLSRATGAPIVYGPNAATDYPIHLAHDGEELKVGRVTIRVLHTPGHTPESTCYLLLDESGKPHAVFTGDTLFVGDVGRPDLLDGKMSKESLAGMMYDSLTTKLKPLPDDLLVYPAHGPGSSCGKNIGKETWSTMGQQKKTNYALQDMSREDFVTTLTKGLAAPPPYYFSDAAINKNGYAALSDVMSKNVRSLSLAEAIDAQAAGAIILDTRRSEQFERGFIPGSVYIGLVGTYAWWAGALIDIKTPLVILANAGQEEESILRLARIGYENVVGYLQGGIESWSAAGKPLAKVHSIEPEDFAKYSVSRSVLDVRNVGEFANGFVEGAENLPLGQLPNKLDELDYETDYVIHCAGGYRSMIAASLMLRSGFGKVTNVHGGFGKIRQYVSNIVVPESLSA